MAIAGATLHALGLGRLGSRAMQRQIRFGFGAVAGRGCGTLPIHPEDTEFTVRVLQQQLSFWKRLHAQAVAS